MKKFVSVLLILCMLFSLGSCGFSAVEISVGISDKITTLDPVKAQGDGEKLIAANCFEGLVRFNDDNNIHLANATSYSLDKTGKIYTFTLNPEAKYHVSDYAKETLKEIGIKNFDNTITADDYVYGIKRYLTYGNGGLENIEGGQEYKNLDSKGVIGVKAVDEYTLEITLEKADPDFLFKLASLPVYPCDKTFVDKLGDSYATTPGTLLSNGPFYVESTDELEVAIKSCSDYNGLNRTKNTTVTLYTTGKAEAYEDRFVNGSYDVYFADSHNALDGDYQYNFYNTTVWGIGFNGESPIGKNKTLRDIIFKTLSVADFEIPSFGTSLAKRIVPDSFILKDVVYGEDAPALQINEDKEKAQLKLKALLEKKNETSISLIFAFPTELKAQAEKILENWNVFLAPQLNITTVQYEIDKAEKFLSDGSFDIAIMPLTSEMPTALSLLETLKEKPLVYKNDSLHASLYKRQNFDSDLIDVYRNAEETIVKENIFFPLFYSGKKLYYSSDITGIFAANKGELIYFHNAERLASEITEKVTEQSTKE